MKFSGSNAESRDSKRKVQGMLMKDSVTEVFFEWTYLRNM